MKSIFNELESSGLLFAVKEEPLQTASGISVPRKKALVNESTGDVISVVGADYKVVDNREVFDAFSRSVLASGIDITGAMVDIKQSEARSLVKFTFPSEVVTVPGDSSETALQIAVLNSFDGTTRYLTKAGGLRMACLNGNILGSIVGSYSSMHNNKLSVEEGADQLVRMMRDFRGATEYWGRMMQRPVSAVEANKVIAKFLLIDDTEEDWMERPLATKLLRLWSAYGSEMGRNAYALYNALTDFVTHREYKAHTAATTATYFERRITKLLDTSPVFAVN